MSLSSSSPLLDVVIPVYNEERDLPRCVDTLWQFMTREFSFPWRILIADNGSTDATLSIATGLSQKYPHVSCVHIPEKGRGRALRRAWLESPAEIVSYMDVDLSTDLEALPKLVSAIRDEKCDIAIGSRLMKGSRVKRSFKRESISRAYILLVRAAFFISLSDAQCGFKALSRRAVNALIPQVKDTGWFFDSELLIIAKKRGFHIKELPVHWVDDPDTRVKVFKTAWGDIKGILRLRFSGIPRVPP